MAHNLQNTQVLCVAVTAPAVTALASVAGAQSADTIQ
jgi:hypothetical protein